LIFVLTRRIHTDNGKNFEKQNLKLQNNASPMWKVAQELCHSAAQQTKPNHSLINCSSPPNSNASTEFSTASSSLQSASRLQNDEKINQCVVNKNNQQQSKENEIQQDFKVGTRHKVLLGRLKSPTDILITNADMRSYERFSKRLSEWYIMNGHSLEFDENDGLTVG
jgi:hypothetical protein